MFSSFCKSTSSIKTEACLLNLYQVCMTSFSCFSLFVGGLFLLIKFRKRCFRTLLRFHNVRFGTELLLLIVGSIELASAFLPNSAKIGSRNVTLPFRTTNSILAVIFVITSIVYHRLVEIKSYPGFLCNSVFATTILAAFRVYRVVDVSQYYDVFHLEVFVHTTSLCLLINLASVDAITIYKERLKPTNLNAKDDTPEEVIGYRHSVATFLSKITFWWLTPLLWRGYKTPLEQEYIGNLREEDSARYYYDQFLFIYKTTKVRNAQLWLCYLKSSWKLFILGGFLKLLGDLSALVGPLSIYNIVEYIEENFKSTHELNLLQTRNNVSIGRSGAEGKVNSTPFAQELTIYYPDWNQLLSNGWVIGWFVLVSSLAQGALSQASTHVVNMIGIRIKTSLQGLVYRKTLLLSSSCLYNPKEANKLSMCVKDVGTITNLMSEDALNVMTFFWIAHYVWSIPLKVGLVMYLLYRKLGVSAIIGSLVCILTMIPLQFLIGRAMSKNSEKAAECTDERLKKTNDIFLGIKLIKLNAWENIFRDNITSSRNRELKYLNRDSVYWFLMTTLAHISSILITFVTLAVFITLETDTAHMNNFGNKTNIKRIVGNFTRQIIPDEQITDGGYMEFNASRLFSALALFNQLTVPLFIFPITVPIIISAIVSTKRLERFLQEPEVQKEFEGIRNMARILSKSDASLDMYESSNEPSMVESVSISEQVLITPSEPKTPPPNSAVTINFEDRLSRSSKDFNSLTKRKTELVRNSRVESVRLRQKPTHSKENIRFSAAENVVVSIQNSMFSWDKFNTRLKVNQLEIPKGKLSIVVGKNASGKTSLLSALLKEMHQLSGEVAWNKYATIAYVPQVPWLLNSTIRENILFGESYRPKRYEKVVEACALKPDIELMPAGDLTLIGERGINLSGGQKQRVVIARAVYSSANVVMMDDPLSSLDNEVGKHIYDNCIKKMLLKANRTVLLVTQRLELVYSADYIIAMKDGNVESTGTFGETERKHPEIVSDWNFIMSKGAMGEQLSSGKTARERWRLFKNISKLGLQRLQSVESENISSTHSLLSSKRRQSVYGSRHLTYEIPFPIDECQNEDIIILRRGSKRARKCYSLELGANSQCVVRVNSLQTQPLRLDRTPVTRIVSSPISLYDTRNNFRIIENDLKSKSGFRQFLNRMSSRRSKNDMSTKAHKSLRVSSSIQSITEEAHPPLARLVSESSNSSVYIDDESVIDHGENDCNLIYDEVRQYGEIPLQIYLLYLKSCGLPMIIVFGMTAFIWQCIKVYLDFWLRDWTDLGDADNIMHYFSIYALISALCIIVSLMSTSAGQAAGCAARKKLHENLLNSMFSKSLYFFQVTPIGRIINRFSNDMSIIDKKIASTSQRLLQFTLLCLFAVLINTSITPWFIALTFPISGAYFFIQKFYRCSSRELQRIESITSSPVISHFTETIQGMTTIRAYSQESRFTEILFKKLEANTSAFIILNTSNRWLGIALDYLGGVIVFVAIVTALISCAVSSVKNGEISSSPSPSMVGMAINYTLFIPIYLNWVVKLLSDMEMYIGAVERIAYYDESGGDASLKEHVYKTVPISWPARGDIMFQNVSLRYSGHHNKNVITNLTLKIPAGQRIGICGRTGSGKSSLVLSLFGVLHIAEGQILIDDVDITAVNPDEIRSRLSIIPQDVHLFNASIRENLDPRGYYTDLQLWNCLELAQLKDIVNGIPLGLDAEIVDGGSNLSAGQRQLFCLARAVLRGSVCLILDEATSSLDCDTELALLKAADNAFKGRTIITIAHRLTTILNYDRIIVLENGNVVEDGSYTSLESIPNGKFATMLKTATT